MSYEIAIGKIKKMAIFLGKYLFKINKICIFVGNNVLAYIS